MAISNLFYFLYLLLGYKIEQSNNMFFIIPLLIIVLSFLFLLYSIIVTKSLISKIEFKFYIVLITWYVLLLIFLFF